MGRDHETVGFDDHEEAGQQSTTYKRLHAPAAATPTLTQVVPTTLHKYRMKGTLYTHVHQLHVVALTEILAYIAMLVQSGSLTTGQIVKWFRLRLLINRDRFVTCIHFAE